MSPTARTAPAYISELAPLLQENGLLAEQVLVVAAGVHNKTMSEADAAAAWSADLTPLAEHIRNHADLTEVPIEWSGRHVQLVDVWSDRAEAYRALTEALRDGDRASWLVARGIAEEVKVREERWFNEVNNDLRPLRITLDPYP